MMTILSPRIRRLCGFTLIELLVVIAIIAILAAILFPVFSKAREKARQVSCMNNQKQLATATLLYVQDNEETFPPADTFWQSLDVSAKVLICSTAGKSVKNAYVYSNAIAGKPLGEIPDPHEEMVTADGQHAGGADGTIPQIAYRLNDIAFRHNKQTIVSFADGHVEATTNPPDLLSIRDGVALWLKANSMPPSTLYLDNVTLWNDKSINRLKAEAVPRVNASSPYPPVYMPNSLNGRPSLLFMGGQMLEIPYTMTTNPEEMSLFIVTRCFKPTMSGEFQAVLSARHINVPATSPSYGYFVYAAGGPCKWRFYYGATSETAYILGPNAVKDAVTVLSCVYTKTGSTGKLYVNGADGGTVANKSLSPNRKLALRIGAGANEGSPMYYYYGYIGEILLYDRTVSDTERQTIEQYLKDKYRVN